MDNKLLVQQLMTNGAASSPEIIEAFRAIDRRKFVPELLKEVAYFDYPLPIGYSQTISQPTTIAFMLELLKPERGQRILDVGSGSGWTTALLGWLVGPSGRVIGVERLPELVEFGKANIETYHQKQIEIIEATEELGLAEEAPFDRILVSAEIPEIPHELVEQLSLGGRMVLPVEHSLMAVSLRRDGIVEADEYPGFIFRPLIVNEA